MAAISAAMTDANKFWPPCFVHADFPLYRNTFVPEIWTTNIFGFTQDQRLRYHQIPFAKRKYDRLGVGLLKLRSLISPSREILTIKILS